MLFTAETEEPKDNMAVAIEDGVITSLSPINQVNDRIGFDEVIDLTEYFVMPGLFDCHTHCAFDGTFSELSDDYMYSTSPGTFALKGIKNVQGDLMGGFTSLRDVGCCPDWSDVAVRDAINEGMFYGPRMMVCGVTINATGGHGDNHFRPQFSARGRNNVRQIISGADEARNAARLNFKYGADCIKFMSSYGIMTPGDDPGAQELTYEEMRAIIEVAEFRGMTTCTHAHGVHGIQSAIKAGVTSIEHGSFMDEETAELMVKTGTFLVPTLLVERRMLTNMKPGEIKPNVIKKSQTAMKVHTNNIGMAYQKGVKIAFGTDVGAPYLYHGTQTEEFVWMVNGAGMKPAHALQAATKNAAELLKWDKRVGTITEGKLADLIAVKGNPLDDISVMMDVAFVMKDGTIYKSAHFNN